MSAKLLPSLRLLLVVSIGLTGIGTSAAAAPQPPKQVDTLKYAVRQFRTQSTALEQALFTLVEATRAANAVCAGGGDPAAVAAAGQANLTNLGVTRKLIVNGYKGAEKRLRAHTYDDELKTYYEQRQYAQAVSDVAEGDAPLRSGLISLGSAVGANAGGSCNESAFDRAAARIDQWKTLLHKALRHLQRAKV